VLFTCPIGLFPKFTPPLTYVTPGAPNVLSVCCLSVWFIEHRFFGLRGLGNV